MVPPLRVALTGNDAIRLAEAAREGTARAVANFAVTEQGFAPDAVLLADGRLRFPSPDALSGGPLGGLVMAPILLVNPGLPVPTEEFITENAAAIQQVIALGGTAAVPTEVLNAACEAGGVPVPGQTPTTNQTFGVTPAEAAENIVSTSSGADANRGVRQYSVDTGDATSVRIELIPCDEVTVTDGTVTFGDNEGTANQADDLGNTAGKIETVNGVATDGTDSQTASPVNGSVTFTVDSETANICVVPVVYTDADNDGELDLVVPATANTTPKEPSEAFGIGGAKTFVPTEAAQGTVGVAGSSADAQDEEILSVNKETDRIVTGTATYFYDANDTFFIADAQNEDGDLVVAANEECDGAADQVTLAEFEAQLSAGDQLDGATFYQPDPALSSSFCLEDLAPVTPTATASEISENSVEMDVTNRPAGAEVLVKIVDDAADCTTGTALATKTTSTDEDATETGFQVTVTGLQASTAYKACTAFIVDGEQSNFDEDVFTTLAAGATAQPQSTDAYIVEDLNGEVSGEDEWRIVFNKVMDPIDVDDRIQVADAQGEILNVFCGGATVGINQDSEVVCFLNTADVTINGTTFPAGRVLTVQFIPGESYAADNTVAGGDGVVDYPATITAQTGITDLNGNAWDIAGSPDKVIDAETVTETGTFAAEATAPTLTSTAGSGNSLTTNWSEAVDGLNPALFDVFSDNTCATAVAEGTGFTSDNGDATLGTTLNNTLAAGSYFVLVTTGAVEDLQGNDNATTACTAVTFS